MRHSTVLTQSETCHLAYLTIAKRNYTVSQVRKTGPFSCEHNFGKYQILMTFSLLQTEINWDQVSLKSTIASVSVLPGTL